MVRFAEAKQQVPLSVWLVCAVAAPVVWWSTPTLLLVAAVIFTCFNYGQCAAQETEHFPVVDLVVRGGALLLAGRLHPEDTMLVMSNLTSPSGAGALCSLISIGSNIHIGCLVLSMLYHMRR